MRPDNGEAPGMTAPGLPRRIATTTFQKQTMAGGQDTAQATLDDYYRQELTERVRDTGLQAAKDADREWCRKVTEWIYDLPPGFEFTADDIRREHGTSQASGSVIRTAAQRRVIVRAGFTESQAVSRHGGTIRVWVRT